MIVRPETPADAAAIRSVVTRAFESAPFSAGHEAHIVDRLRHAGALSVSLVAELDRDVVGYVAFSPVSVDPPAGSWYGLGPLAVLTEKRRQGIAAALVKAGLNNIAALGANGCVVLGDPAYYHRFGFSSDPDLRLAGVPPNYFQKLVLRGSSPNGMVNYHPAFSER